MVPFLDLQAQYTAIKEEIEGAIRQVFETSAFSGGAFVTQFETSFAQFCEAKFAVGVGSGTEALWLTLLAMNVGPGDEVITVPNTFFATVEAIMLTGARPVFVDVDPKTYTMDPSLVEGAITPNTKVIIPVHLFGQIADMDPIVSIARKHNLRIVEDACQAHGASYKGKKAGTIGDAGCFSFYPSKNLGACGEAGAIVTNNESLKRTVEMLKDHGQSSKYNHQLVGWNGRMDGIQAAVLQVKLKHLEVNNRARHEHARTYDQLLVGAKDLATPHVADHGIPSFHLYVVRTRNRDALASHLTRRSIGWGIHYPVPVHLQPACAGLKLARGSFPVSERIAQEILSLPMFPELTSSQIFEVAAAVKEGLAIEEAGGLS